MAARAPPARLVAPRPLGAARPLASAWAPLGPPKIVTQAPRGAPPGAPRGPVHLAGGGAGKALLNGAKSLLGGR